MPKPIRLYRLSPEQKQDLLNKIVQIYTSLGTLQERAMFFQRLSGTEPSVDSLLECAITLHDESAIAVLNHLGCTIPGISISDIGDLEYTTSLVGTYGFKPFLNRDFTTLCPQEAYRTYLLSKFKVCSTNFIPDFPPDLQLLILQYAVSTRELEQCVHDNNPQNHVLQVLYSRYRHPRTLEGFESIPALENLLTIESAPICHLEGQVKQLLDKPEHQDKPYTADLSYTLLAIQLKMGKEEHQESCYPLLQDRITRLKQAYRKQMLLHWAEIIFQILFSLTMLLAVIALLILVNYGLIALSLTCKDPFLFIFLIMLVIPAISMAGPLYPYWCFQVAVIDSLKLSFVAVRDFFQSPWRCFSKNEASFLVQSYEQASKTCEALQDFEFTMGRVDKFPKIMASAIFLMAVVGLITASIPCSIPFLSTIGLCIIAGAGGTSLVGLGKCMHSFFHAKETKALVGKEALVFEKVDRLITDSSLGA